MKALRRNHTSTSSSKSLTSNSSSPLLSSSPSSSSSSSSSPFNRNHTRNNKKHSSLSSSSSSSSASSSWVHLRSVLFVVASSTPNSSSYSSDRSHLKSPWSRRRRKHILTAQLWRSSFTPDGELRDSGIKLLKKIRTGGVDPSIRAEVWPFLLGVYDLNSSKESRDAIKNKNREEYENLRKQCRRLRKQTDGNTGPNENDCCSGDCGTPSEDSGSPASEVVSARESLSSEKRTSDAASLQNNSNTVFDRTSTPRQSTSYTPSIIYSGSSDSESSDDEQLDEASPYEQPNDADVSLEECPSTNISLQSNLCRTEDFASWQRIIRLDAIRANEEWIAYSPSQADVPKDRAHRSAEAVGLKDYDHLDPCRIHHAARLVSILEAYAVYDSEIGYCQGMSDLLSPIISVIEEDYTAFWCFVGFMKKARHNFRLDEVGIRRQLRTVGKIIKYKDSHLYKHLVKLQAEDCFFVYRMVVVLFRRELNFEQTLCLWEVMWTDQTAIRAGIGKSGWSRIRQRAPPTDDLLLYAIAASVLQRRKQIIEKYSSMDEILRECNNMAGQLDVWKLLDDAHDLVITLHDKVDSPF